MATKQIITEVETRQDFLKLLQNNPSIIVVKLGATWCGPCKKIKQVCEAFFLSGPNDAIYLDLDVDTSIDVYAFLKTKKMVNGIPALLCYAKGNTSYASDIAISGTDPKDLDLFFKNCGELYKKSKEFV